MDFTRKDRIFEDHRAANPGASFGRFFAEKALRKLGTEGHTHATLGPSLSRDDGGAATFRIYRRYFPLTPQTRVVDYGCGSLRLGRHFIELLEPGNYFGLDIIAAFYERFGNVEAMADKRPRLAEISDVAVEQAAAHDADFVFSSAVAFHVHPEEAGQYFGNLARIAHRADVRLVFEAVIAAEPVRYTHRSWAWPLAWFEAQLPGFTVDVKRRMPREKAGVPMEVCLLEWRH